MLQRFCLVVGVPVGVVFHHVLGLGHTCTLFRCQLQALHGTAIPVLVLIPVLVEVLDLALVPALEEFEVLSRLQTPCCWVTMDTIGGYMGKNGKNVFGWDRENEYITVLLNFF